MSSTSSFEEFAARLRGFIQAAQRVAGRENVFGELALDLFALQFEHNEPYRRFCESRRVSPRTVEHWSRVPAIPTSAFKELELSCLPAAERTAVFYSSGTTEQRPSRHFHHAESLAVYEASLLAWFETQAQNEARRFISLTPPRCEAPHSSLVAMFEAICRRFGSPDSGFVGKVAPDGSWVLDYAAAQAAFRSAISQQRPITVLGTAFSFVHLLDHLANQNLEIRLPAGSRALETGGYKGRSRSLAKAELHALIIARLGIPATHIVCEYGMSELSSQAYDNPAAEQRIFRFPPWARAQLISPETGLEAGEGQTGLIRVFDLANVYSVMAIQTEDLGVRHGDGFELVGRAAMAESRGCSLMAT
jgi:hypothetical protein